MYFTDIIGINVVIMYLKAFAFFDFILGWLNLYHFLHKFSRSRPRSSGESRILQSHSNFISHPFLADINHKSRQNFKGALTLLTHIFL